MNQRRQTSILVIFCNILHKYVNNSKRWKRFHNITLTLQEAFETAAQIKEKLEKAEFDGAFCKKFKLLIHRFSSFFR